MPEEKELVKDLRLLPRMEIAARLAELELQGHGIHKIVSILTTQYNYRFTRTQVEKMKSEDTYIKVIEGAAQRYVRQAQNRIRSHYSKRAEKIINALDELIDEKNITAIITALKLLGVLEKVEGEQKQAQQLTVILPGKKSSGEKA